MVKVVYIRSRRGKFARDGHPALKSHPDGRIQANRFGKALKWETWKLHILREDESSVALEAWTGKFLSAKEDGSVAADSDKPEAWHVEGTGKEMRVSLKSRFGKYLCCDDKFDCGKTVRADRDKVLEWEEWMIVTDPLACTNPGKTARLAFGGTLVGVGSLLTIGALAIPLLGFRVAGVAAGSTAAAVQSAVYGGATCGVFSVLQSAGATLAWVPVAAGGGVTTACGTGALCGGKKEKK